MLPEGTKLQQGLKNLEEHFRASDFRKDLAALLWIPTRPERIDKGSMLQVATCKKMFVAYANGALY